ncbi:MAG: hypothetical protein NT006_01815 [Candidatus Aminicenantes bacterium]|nr:hypothetical protein [Candidatus Aminicenantes bacterium]
MTNKNGPSNKVSRILARNTWSTAVLAVTLAMSGCAMLGIGAKGTSRLETSPMLPSVEGNARFSVTVNDNTSITLTVKHLAKPERLTPPASHYVVWTRATKDAAAQNIGALVVDKSLDGKIVTETSLHSFDLFITAEDSSQIQQPSGQPLLWMSYSR